MKKNMLKSIGLVLTFCFLASFLSAGTAPAVTFASDYVDKDLSPFGSIFYHDGIVMSVPEGKDLAHKIFNHCGLGSAFVLDSGMTTSEMLVYTKPGDETGICMVNLITGEVAFSAGMMDLEGEMDTPGLIDPTHAKQFCNDHLMALDMYPDSDMHELDVNTFKMMALNDGVEKEYSKMVTIMNGRKMLDIPVIGNSRVNMGLGAGGELKFLMWNWMSVVEVPLAEGELLDHDMIRDRITTQLSQYLVDAAEVIVHDNYLTYYDDGWDTIEPAYIFRIEVISPDGDVKEADWVTSVVMNSSAQFAHLEMAPKNPEDNGDPSTDTDDE